MPAFAGMTLHIHQAQMFKYAVYTTTSFKCILAGI